MDPLSDLLRAIRLTGGLFLDARFSAPWAVETRVTEDEWMPFLTHPRLVIAYHVLTEGSMRVTADGASPVDVRAGEIVLLPRNSTHVIASAAKLVPMSARDLIRRTPDGGLIRIVAGGGGDETRMVCGFLGSEDADNPLLAALPPILKVDLREVAAREWIEASVRFAANELAGGRMPESDVVLRLSETLFIEAVRQYLATAPDGEIGWLKAARDPQVSRALALIHADIAAERSVEELARAAGLSRSAFVDRFRDLMGHPPMRYVTLWRLQRAKLRLGETDESIAEIAHGIGYGSEEAFSRAFRREFGMPPAQWHERG